MPPQDLCPVPGDIIVPESGPAAGGQENTMSSIYPPQADRREFLKQIGLAAGTASLVSAAPKVDSKWKNQIGIELYTVRNLLTPEAYEATLAKLAAMGYKEVEPADPTTDAAGPVQGAARQVRPQDVQHPRGCHRGTGAREGTRRPSAHGHQVHRRSRSEAGGPGAGPGRGPGAPGGPGGTGQQGRGPGAGGPGAGGPAAGGHASDAAASPKRRIGEAFMRADEQVRRGSPEVRDEVLHPQPRQRVRTAGRWQDHAVRRVPQGNRPRPGRATARYRLGLHGRPGRARYVQEEPRAATSSGT